jgi:hypothetical protein
LHTKPRTFPFAFCLPAINRPQNVSITDNPDGLVVDLDRLSGCSPCGHWYRHCRVFQSSTGQTRRFSPDRSSRLCRIERGRDQLPPWRVHAQISELRCVRAECRRVRQCRLRSSGRAGGVARRCRLPRAAVRSVCDQRRSDLADWRSASVSSNETRRSGVSSRCLRLLRMMSSRTAAGICRPLQTLLPF